MGLTPSLNKWVLIPLSWTSHLNLAFMVWWMSASWSCMSHLSWRNVFQSHIWRPQFQIFCLPFPKIFFLMSTLDPLGSVTSPPTWWAANALCPLRVSGCCNQHISSNFPIFSGNWGWFPLSREELMRLSLVIWVNMYYIHRWKNCQKIGNIVIFHDVESQTKNRLEKLRIFEKNSKPILSLLKCRFCFFLLICLCSCWGMRGKVFTINNQS